MMPAARNAEASIPAWFWTRAAEARRRLLMLDYDGTIAPFCSERSEAVPLASVPPLLRRIARSGATRLAVISGRPVADVARLLDGVPASFVGAHGWELLGEDGHVRRHPLPESAEEALAAAEKEARDAGLGDHLEVKYGAVVLHTRGMPPGEAREAERRLEASWRALPSIGRALRIRPISGGVEMRALGRDKGSAVSDLLALEPDGALPVYLGDDDTDEDAFRAVRDGGLGIRVGTTEIPTLAEGRLRDCDAVAAFLANWLSLLEEGSARGVAP